MNLLGQCFFHVCSLIPSNSPKYFTLTSGVALVSRDARDLVIMSEQYRVVFIRDFERVCRGETTFEQAGLVLGIQPELKCYGLGFEDGHVCVVTVRISQAPLVNSCINLDF
jgi:hypothetical protein